MGSGRWDRDRVYERDRFEDDIRNAKGGRGRERSEERFDRRRFHYDDEPERHRRYFDDEPRYDPRREPARHPELDRRVVTERERDREYYRDSSSPRRPAFLRRQSSLDTYDRRPHRSVFDQRQEYPAPARREDIYREDGYRAPPYMPIPLPKARGLPPPGRREDRLYDDYRPSEPDTYPDDDFKHVPERVREREVVRERDRRDRSRDSRATRTHTHRSSSGSSSSSRSTSSAGGTTVRSEYPKRGKTRIPVRVVSKRALIDLGYPFIEEENTNTIIVQLALGQDNIDQLLKLSDEYNRADQEVANARSSAGNLLEERIEERRTEIIQTPAPPAPTRVAVPHPPPVETVEYVDKTVIRETSPSRSSSSWDSGHHRRRRLHHHYDDGTVVLVPRSRSRSRSRREIRAEIKALERELVHRPRGEVEREVVRTERLPNGELIVYEEEVERTVARPKPPRIEKDKKGRMSISIPKYR
ncbi:hypothetical protein E4U42_000511 [Claviceps africana]|uniref:DUF8035 domain-containing protein n=1 Tax=Claviceps africana TaxID=83212 RepID=A0A8K0JCJ5_9HYPO|nr:hypothetical protein E4U42_000511 [Claviceps africana]